MIADYEPLSLSLSLSHSLSLSLQLQGFGVSVISGIDPNHDNFVSAGVITTRNMLVGCLLRLEPKRDASGDVSVCLTLVHVCQSHTSISMGCALIRIRCITSFLDVSSDSEVQ